jgi:hypothetical protein
MSVVSAEKNPAGGARVTMRMAVDFAAYTGSTDDASVSAISTAVQNCRKNGKTFTLRGGYTVYPGSDAAQAVYFSGASVSACTVSTAALTGNLTTAAGVELTSSVATVLPVSMIIWGDES